MTLHERLRRSRIILATHYRIYSASQALRDFLRRSGCRRLLYIAHPLPLPDVSSDERSYMEVSHGATVVLQKLATLRVRNVLISSVFEAICALWWIMRYPKTSDVFIGVDNLNALQGLILKRFGKVKKVVYYTIDYFPTRFSDPLINTFYHWIDKVCVRLCDETWNVSPVMAEVRRRDKNMVGEPYGRQYTVPIGIWYDRAPKKPLPERDRYRLVFAGHLVPHMGVDLAIRALPAIAKKVPKATLDIIGGGQEENRLKALARTFGVEDKVRFHGWITDRQKLETMLSTASVGLAPFNTEILDEKVKNADPGKLKDYMAAGLPVIVTDAVSTVAAIKEHACGIVIRYKKDELAEAVIQLLSSPTKLREYRANALRYVGQFDYSRLFSQALARVLPGTRS